VRRIRIFFLPALAATLVVAATLMPGESVKQRKPGVVALAQSTYACPVGAAISVATGQVSAGTDRTVTSLPHRGVVSSLASASSWQTSIVSGDSIIVHQNGRGSGPVGFFSEAPPKGDGGGLLVGSCPEIVDDGWFLGLGSGGKHLSSLTLSNGADTPAVVDLELWGPQGKIDAVDATGLVVDPFTTRRVRLETLAAGEPDLAIRLHRQRGSVSVVANDSSTATFRGNETVTATASPRRSQVVAGLVEGAGGRTLELLNPGPSAARVSVDVLGPKDAFRPSGMSAIKVNAGSVRKFEVPRSAGASAQALLVTSDQPVAATVRMAPDNRDFAYAESVPILTGPAVVPVDLDAVGSPDLIVSAPHRDAKVTVAAFDSGMVRIGSASLTVGGGATKIVDTGKVFSSSVRHGKKIAYLVVRGGVVAAATYVKAGGISSLALTAAPIEALAPDVRRVG